MENDKNPIGRALDIAPIDPISNLLDNVTDNSAINDFDLARANIKSALEKGTQAINDLADLAFRSQNAWDYQALSKLIKDVTDASSKLIDIHERIENVLNKKENKRAQQTEIEGDTTNVNLFISTSEVFRQLKEIDGK